MALLEVFPRPRRITLAGAEYRALELRLGDLAAFEALAEAAGRDPESGLEALDPESAEYAAALDDATVRAERWPPAFGSEEVDAAISGRRGAAELLRRSLRATRPRPTLRECDELAAALTPDEWSAVFRLAWGLSAKQLVKARVGRKYGIADAIPSADSRSWDGAVAELIVLMRGSPEAARRLTLSQARFLLSAGVAPAKSDGEK